jgi:hypothetical protein
MRPLSDSLRKLATRDYGDAPLGYVGNLRRWGAGLQARRDDSPSARAATAPAGWGQRLRGAFWRLLARCAPSSLRARQQVRELSRAMADLLGAMTMKRGADAGQHGRRALREACARLDAVLPWNGRESAEIEALVAPMLRRHLQRLTDYDRRKIATGAPVDLSDGAWPDLPERAFAKQLMACVEKTYADQVCVPALRTAMRDWAGGPARVSSPEEAESRFLQVFGGFRKTRLPLQQMMFLALKDMPAPVLETLRTRLTLAAGDDRDLVLARACLRMAVQQEVACRMALTPQTRQALLGALRQDATAASGKQCARAWSEALRKQIASEDYTDFSGERDPGAQRAFSILAAHELSRLERGDRDWIIHHLDTPALQRMLGMGAAADLDGAVRDQIDTPTTPPGVVIEASSVDSAIERELMRRKDRLATLQAMATTLDAGGRATPVLSLADRLQAVARMLELAAAHEEGADLASGDATEQRMLLTLRRLLDDALWACQHGPRGGRRELGAQDAGVWPVAVLTAVLDLAEPARRHGWNMDRAALRAVLPLRIQEARGAAVDQLRAQFEQLGRAPLPESGPLLDAWARVVVLATEWMRLRHRDQPMFGADDRLQAYAGLVDAAVGDMWSPRVLPGRAAIEHMASLLDSCVTALGAAVDADVGPDGAALIERLNMLSALLATALERCGSLARPGERQGLAPDPRLQAEFERAIVRLEGAS